MSNVNGICGNDFTLVTKKRSNRKIIVTNPHNGTSQACQKDDLSNSIKERYKRILNDRKLEVSASDFFRTTLKSLKEAFSSIGKTGPSVIVCFGLGKVCECLAARYQFALLLCFKEYFKIDVHVYDPVFTELDKHVLEHFNCVILNENHEGKFKANENHTTLFYLPHCPKQLTNNLLWANWGINLSHCVCIANSFTSIIESSCSRLLAENAYYINKISPYTLEFTVSNDPAYFEVFNDTAIHVFPRHNLLSLPDHFWCSPTEPEYSHNTVEFIKREPVTDAKAQTNLK